MLRRWAFNTSQLAEAILTNEMELQNDADFVKCSEAFLQVHLMCLLQASQVAQVRILAGYWEDKLMLDSTGVPPAFGHLQEDLASLMQELLTAAAELNHER